MSLIDLKKRIDATVKESQEGKGKVTRADIVEVLEVYKEENKELDKRKKFVKDFLDSLAKNVITEAGKLKILEDIRSYRV